MSTNKTDDYKTRFGPWGMVVGASDGLGAALAEQLAAKGLNVVLVSRRREVLETLGTELSNKYGVETLAWPVDLTAPDAAAKLKAVSEKVDLGLYLVNVGGDTVASRFIDASLDTINEFVNRNVSMLIEMFHFYGRHFAEKGHGCLAVIGSDAGFNGAGRTSVYSASKAFALNLSESMWAELKPKGVDVVYLGIGATDTPKLRGLMEARGVAPTEINLDPPETLAKWAVELFGEGPTQVFDVDPASMDPLTSPVARRKRVERNTRIIDFFFGEEMGPEVMEELRSGRSWK